MSDITEQKGPTNTIVQENEDAASEKKMETMLWSLEELANMQKLKSDSPTEKYVLDLPQMQRGLVWNPAQVEVLWDSLMRGIPIGCITLIDYNRGGNKDLRSDDDATHGIFDGQQRVNAIALGIKKVEDPSSILWIDLMGKGNAVSPSRKFFFYLTTEGQPWGYKINDNKNENKNDRLGVGERLEAGYCAYTEADGNVCKKPRPKDLRPGRARIPIPFTLLWELGDAPELADIRRKLDELAQGAAETNWERNFKTEYDKNKIKEGKLDEHLESICEGLRIAHKSKVVVVVAPGSMEGSVESDADAPQSDVAVFFSRLSRGGTVPPQEEVNYSILKAMIPSVKWKKDFDDRIAKDRMQPARLAAIAMRLYFAAYEHSWKSSINSEDVRTLAGSERFRQFIQDGEFEVVLRDKFEDKVSYSDNQKWGLPKILLSIIPANMPNLYVFLLWITSRDTPIDGKMLAALALLMAFFATKDEGICRDIYDELHEDPSRINQERLSQLLCEKIRSGKLIPPPRRESLQEVCCRASDADKTNEKDVDIYGMADGEGILQVWDWSHPKSRMLLLYACRSYIEKRFSGYNPASAVYNGDNRPWDYDHIFPQSWLIQGRGKRQGPYHTLVGRFIKCIGNVAPVPFHFNRRKRNDAPFSEAIEPSCNEYVRWTKELFCDDNESDHSLLETEPTEEIEKNPRLSQQLAGYVARRMCKLYCEMYENLDFGELLGFADSVTKRRDDVFKAFRKQLSEEIGIEQSRINSWFHTNSGLQAKLEEDSDDWNKARPWIACGVEVKSQVEKQVEGKVQRGLVCICSDGDIVEYGLRRHPADNNINGDYGLYWLYKDSVWAKITESYYKDGSLVYNGECKFSQLFDKNGALKRDELSKITARVAQLYRELKSR